MRRVLVVLVLLVSSSWLTACGSDPPDYKTVTCGQWQKLDESDLLDVALDFMQHLELRPSGAAGSGDFASLIDALCDTKPAGHVISTSENLLYASFVNAHPDAVD